LDSRPDQHPTARRVFQTGIAGFESQKRRIDAASRKAATPEAMGGGESGQGGTGESGQECCPEKAAGKKAAKKAVVNTAPPAAQVAAPAQ
jgi:CRISPR/Cas system CMR-associated protein Cmr5 small subunit